MTIYRPNLRPQQFGFKDGDYHVIANAISKDIKAYNFNGSLIFQIKALLDGQHPNWRVARGDTPPGLYKFGAIYNDYEIYGNNPPNTRDINSYGWGFIDLIDLEGNEDNNGRAGIAIHGGGTGLGFPNCWNKYQQLLETWGCIRTYNYDVVNYLIPLKEKNNTVFVSVFQDDK